MTYTIIFLHGALLGGWIWQDVSDAFRNQGHEVIAADLPGRDESAAEKVKLADHVSAISALIERSKHPVVLVAHSMNCSSAGRRKFASTD